MKNINRLLIALLAGIAVFTNSTYLLSEENTVLTITMSAATFVLALLILLSPGFIKIDRERLFFTSIGCLLGIISGYLILSLVKAVSPEATGIGVVLFILAIIFFGQVGSQLTHATNLKIFNSTTLDLEESPRNREKILDTSVIIDGRILDIAETNFIEGPFIIPNFVLREIQLISDSPDPIKRNRGRRGLEMLNKLQQHGSVKVKISYEDYTDTREVDAKLVKLARDTGARLVTNDFNLNKVAELQGVLVLNLNNLTNALKPVVLPGEDIYIDVIKEGKDENQGIGYLEDGTMVVIENGGALLGKAVKVNVTSIIQTAAGKMIFTRATDDEPGDQQSSIDEHREMGSGGGGDRGGRRRRGRNGGGGRGKDRDDSREASTSGGSRGFKRD